ncbi:nuclease-related domain-containing protein [Chloroflexota bacterium]
MIKPNYNIDHLILSRHGVFVVETKTIGKLK